MFRDDDAELADALRALPFGTFSKRMAGYGNSRPQIGWAVQNKAECLEVIRVLDRCPMRSKKKRDYAIWREAVFFWQEQRTGCKAGNKSARFAELKAGLEEGRRL